MFAVFAQAYENQGNLPRENLRADQCKPVAEGQGQYKHLKKKTLFISFIK